MTHNEAPLRTEHFEIWAERPEETGREMEARFNIYNRLFRFDPAGAALPLKVRVFQDTGSYNQYVQGKTGIPSPGAVYLHYRNPGSRELVINRDADGAEKALPYQAFIQFFRAFIPQPPAWMQEGFAVFFSTLIFTGEGRPVYEENLAWLETVKTLRNRPGPRDIVSGAGGGDFPALAWSLVSFFLNSEKEPYLRSLTDSFMALSPAKTREENAEAVMKRIFLDIKAEDLAADYQRYLDSRKTFTSLAAEGQRAYAANDMTGAELLFRGALNQKPDHFVPYYYLGLIAYNGNRFAEAEQYYRGGLERGAEPALILYALGINAAAAGKNAEAADYLRQAAEAGPARYGQKTGALIPLLEGRR
jgi:hypothetical protein